MTGRSPPRRRGSTSRRDADSGHSSPRGKSTPPKIEDEAWPRSETDRYLLAALEAKGLKPVGDADKYTLLRRVWFDLIGLPPTPEEVDTFVKDESPAAFETVVDRLLAAPQFGERWGRHWLDVARFAESSGKQVNFNYPHAWRYRDYVIAAFNTDKPYNRFIKEQIAGDLLPAADLCATRRADDRDGFPRRRGQVTRGAEPVAVSDGPGGRADRRDLAGLPRTDRGLRPLPRSQVRPDPDA